MKKSSTSSESSKLDRKTIERNRRIHMKNLCFKLSCLIPSNHKLQQYSKSKDKLPQQDLLDLAARYIEQQRERIEELKKQKEQAIVGSNQTHKSKMINNNGTELSLPLLELRDLGSSIEVVLVSGFNKSFMLYKVISVLEEEGAQVVNASFSTVGDKIFYTVHAQVKISRVGVETTRVNQRLQELIAPLEI